VFQQWRQHALKAHVEHNPMFTALQVILYSCTASAVTIVNYERSVPPQWVIADSPHLHNRHVLAVRRAECQAELFGEDAYRSPSRRIRKS
jgi:hypothetical protein